MAQHDYVIANQGFPDFRSDLNSALSAVVSQNSGSSAPSTTFANQIWYDSSNNILKMRNEDNDAWINLFTLDQSADTSTVTIANNVLTNAQQTFTKAQVPSTYTAALSATSGVLDYDTYQNFIITLASGSNTLAAPTTEASQIGQCGVIIFIQPSSSSAATLSLHGDYETAEAAGITLSTANNDYDLVAYCVKADNRVLLSQAQLNFG